MGLPHIIETILDALEPLYATYGYPLVLLAALLEHTFFLAWAIPGGILVALGGFYAQSGGLALPLVIALGALGFTAGDHLDYLVGRRGTRTIQRVTGGRIAPMATLLHWRALPALLLAYTNTIPRSTMFMGGAAAGLPYRRFISLSLPMALFWSALNGVLGYWLGSNRDRLEAALKAIGLGGQIGLVCVLAVVLAIYLVRRFRRRSRLAAPDPLPGEPVAADAPADTDSA